MSESDPDWMDDAVAQFREFLNESESNENDNCRDSLDLTEVAETGRLVDADGEVLDRFEATHEVYAAPDDEGREL